MFQRKKEPKKEQINIRLENDVNPIYKDKNDTFYIIIKAYKSIDNFFLFCYSHISFDLRIINKKVYNLLFFPFLFVFLFSIVLNENINISTDLLINAYFNDSQITHISYDKIIKGKFEDEQNNHISNKKYPYNVNNDINNCQICYENQNNKNSFINKCCKNDDSDNQSSYDQERDFYLLSLFPIKRIFITCFAFFSLYIIIKTTYYSRINNSIFINMVGVYTSFKILSYLYFNKYYLASGLIFILFFYFFKCTIDSIYLLLRFKRSDFEIFSIHLSASNFRQFMLKFFILFTGTLLSGLLSAYYFQLYFNYMAFYTCLFTFIIFICNCAENKLLGYKYSKNIFIFLFGLINFIVNKNLKKKYYSFNDDLDDSTNLSEEFNLYHIVDFLMIPTNFSNTNSFYIISDIFTLICFDYLDDYIEFKYKNFLDKKKKNKKIYSKEDIIFHCLFILSIVLSISGIRNKEYMCFILSLNISQKFNNYFSTIFNHNLSRTLNHIILIVYIITQYEISLAGDEYLISLILNIKVGKEIVHILLKIIGISILLYDLIYSNYIYYYSNNSHQTFYHYYNGFDIIENENEINDNIEEIANNDESSNSEENENMMEDENFYEIASQINNKKYKIKIIHSSYDENSHIIFYLTSEIVLCYIDTCIIIIFCIAYEQNILVKLVYGLIIIFLNSRKYFILNEIKNNGQYYFYYLISFFFAIRLIILTNNNSDLLNYLAHINVYILLAYYCFINKRNYFLSIILLIHLSVAHANLKSNFILFDIISVLVFLLFKNLNSKKKYKIDKYEDQSSNLSLIFLLSLMIFFLLQLYGISKLCSLFQDLYNKIINFYNEMSLLTYGGNKENKRKHPIEYYIITDLINWLEKNKNNFNKLN